MATGQHSKYQNLQHVGGTPETVHFNCAAKLNLADD